MKKIYGSRYECLECIGQGGMASVYLAFDKNLQRQVAIKVMHEHMQAREQLRKRFLQEAYSVSKLNHPNILEIYDFSGEETDDLWIVMEHIEGYDLNDYTACFPNFQIHPLVATCIIREVAKALTEAHKHGIIHRDIKSSNIMVSYVGQIKLMDFGIAKNLVVDNDLTQTGSFIGSPTYMSPEQVRGELIDACADIYALSVLFFKLLSGELPYDGSNTHKIIEKVLSAPVPKVTDIKSNTPAFLSHFIAKGMSKNPKQRHQAVHIMVDALDDFLKQHQLGDSGIELEVFFSNPKEFAQKVERHMRSVKGAGLVRGEDDQLPWMNIRHKSAQPQPQPKLKPKLKLKPKPKPKQDSKSVASPKVLLKKSPPKAKPASGKKKPVKKPSPAKEGQGSVKKRPQLNTPHKYSSHAKKPNEVHQKVLQKKAQKKIQKKPASVVQASSKKVAHRASAQRAPFKELMAQVRKQVLKTATQSSPKQRFSTASGRIRKDTAQAPRGATVIIGRQKYYNAQGNTPQRTYRKPPLSYAEAQRSPLARHARRMSSGDKFSPGINSENYLFWVLIVGVASMALLWFGAYQLDLSGSDIRAKVSEFIFDTKAKVAYEPYHDVAGVVYEDDNDSDHDNNTSSVERPDSSQRSVKTSKPEIRSKKSQSSSESSLQASRTTRSRAKSRVATSQPSSRAQVDRSVRALRPSRVSSKPRSVTPPSTVGAVQAFITPPGQVYLGKSHLGSSVKVFKKPFTLRPGSYRLSISKPGYYSHTQNVVVKKGQLLKLGRIVLKKIAYHSLAIQGPKGMRFSVKSLDNRFSRSLVLHARQYNLRLQKGKYQIVAYNNKGKMIRRNVRLPSSFGDIVVSLDF